MTVTRASATAAAEGSRIRPIIAPPEILFCPATARPATARNTMVASKIFIARMLRLGWEARLMQRVCQLRPLRTTATAGAAYRSEGFENHNDVQTSLCDLPSRI